MGIRQLNKIINLYSPSAIKEISIDDIIGSKIAIDSSIFIYKYRHVDRNSENSHLNGFLYKLCFYLKKGIIPIFIFDGYPPEAKKQTLIDRGEKKDKIKQKINNLEEIIKSKLFTEQLPNELSINIEIRKLKNQITNVTKIHRQECKYFLKLLGIPIIESEGEAEQTCAILQKKGIVDYTFTEDTDSLTFGAPKVLKSAKKVEKIIITDLNQILMDFKFNMDEFIDFCILCGCDYCPTINRIGPKTAFELIKKYRNIETVLDNIKNKYKIPDNFDYKTARMLFNKDTVNDKKYEFKINNIDQNNLYKFIIDEKKLDTNYYSLINKKVNKAKLEYNKIKKQHQQQNTILNFFNTSQNPKIVENPLPKEFLNFDHQLTNQTNPIQ